MRTPIQAQLDRLRRRIRTYVWCEGIAVALVWLCLTFWVGLALDYLPVRLGGTEMPTAARAALLVMISGVLLFIGYRWIARRAMVPLRDESLALLLERSHPELEDALVTTVQLEESAKTENASEVTRELYAQTVTDAAGRLDRLDLSRVFDSRPLWRAGLAAVALAVSVVGFAVASESSFSLWCKRLYGLSSDPYPRETRLEMVGWQDQITVPKGSDFNLRVRADANRDVPPPDVCTVYFKTADGETGRVNMSRIGKPREGYQYYAYEGKPFRGVLSDLEFDVVGNDFRLKDQQLLVAERPQIVGLEVAMTLPAYTGLLPRVEPYRSGLPVPQGSTLQIRATSTKPLADVIVEDKRSSEQFSLVPESGNTFAYDLPAVEESFVHEISITDTEDISNERPYRLDIAVVPDMPPKINSRLVGIGSAVTIEARIPIEAELEDDFGVTQAWIELVTSEPQPRQIAMVPDTLEMVSAAVDLREMARDASNPLELAVDTKLTLAVMAIDGCDIGAGPHQGQGPVTELEVVTPNRLTALLEARELGLRKRLEQIIDESRQTRDSLSRVNLNLAPQNSNGEEEEEAESASGEIGDQTQPETSNDEDDDVALIERVSSGVTISQLERERALRLLRVQRAKQQVDRSSAEVKGIAMSFDDIRLELINNRIDSAERQNRIERDIAAPLRDLSANEMQALSRRLRELELLLNDQSKAEVLKGAAIQELDQVILALERVLEKMLDLETFSELIDLVNSLIRDQEALLEQTKKERKKRALDLLK